MRLIRLLKNDIAREAQDWVNSGAITEAQAEQICSRYAVDYHQVNNSSFGYRTLVGLGYLFIGLSVITLLGANWDDIPRALRMACLVVLTLGTQAYAIKTYIVDKGSSATGIFLLGNMFYGASIILIAQTYHLGEHMPDGVFWWALGCLPFGVILNNAILTLQALILGLTWFIMETQAGFYPTTFPLFIGASLLVLYRGKTSFMLFLTAMASLAIWFEYSLSELWRDTRRFEFQPELVAVSVAVCLLAYVCSQWLGQKQSVKAQDYAASLSLWCLRLGLIFMLVMSFVGPWKELLKATWDNSASMYGFIIALTLLSLILAGKTKQLKPVSCAVALYVVALLTVIHTDDPVYAIYFQAASNLLLVALGIWLIARGIHSGISHYFFLGVGAILLTALLRYIDLIGDYVGGAALFMLFALLLLGAARYWKNYQSTERLT